MPAGLDTPVAERGATLSVGQKQLLSFARALAFDPPLLESTWREVKALMATSTTLDPLTKELIYIAVSIANSCSYCVHSHTAAARAKGMSDEMHADLLRVVSTAGRTNQLLNGLQIPVDPEFERR